MSILTQENVLIPTTLINSFVKVCLNSKIWKDLFPKNLFVWNSRKELGRKNEREIMRQETVTLMSLPMEAGRIKSMRIHLMYKKVEMMVKRKHFLRKLFKIHWAIVTRKGNAKTPRIKLLEINVQSVSYHFVGPSRWAGVGVRSLGFVKRKNIETLEIFYANFMLIKRNVDWKVPICGISIRIHILQIFSKWHEADAREILNRKILFLFSYFIQFCAF